MKLREVIGGWCTCKSKMHPIFVLQNQSGTTVSAYAHYILPVFPLGYIRTPCLSLKNICCRINNLPYLQMHIIDADKHLSDCNDLAVCSQHIFLTIRSFSWPIQYWMKRDCDFQMMALNIILHRWCHKTVTLLNVLLSPLIQSYV